MGKIQDALKRIQGNAEIETSELANAGARTSYRKSSQSTLHKGEPRPLSAVLEASDSAPVDISRLYAAGLLLDLNKERGLAIQIRDIKRPLIAHAFGKRATRIPGGNIMMVTSALAGEGKTFTSVNLAFSMAQEQDHSVLLIDADVAKPHMTSIFGLESARGLLDVLEDTSLPLGQVVVPTTTPGLSILPAGKPRPNANELIAGSRMESLISSLSDAKDGTIVLLDSPPLLQTSESKVLAFSAGQIVVVVRADHTPRDAVLAAVDLLDETKAINLVLNRAGADAVRPAYGNYSYSGIDEYSDQPMNAPSHEVADKSS